MNASLLRETMHQLRRTGFYEPLLLVGIACLVSLLSPEALVLSSEAGELAMIELLLELLLACVTPDAVHAAVGRLHAAMVIERVYVVADKGTFSELRHQGLLYRPGQCPRHAFSIFLLLFKEVASSGVGMIHQRVIHRLHVEGGVLLLTPHVVSLALVVRRHQVLPGRLKVLLARLASPVRPTKIRVLDLLASRLGQGLP